MFVDKLLTTYALQIDKNLVHSVVYYSPLWFIIGILFLLAVSGIIFYIIYATRKKTIQTLSNLKSNQPKVVRLDDIRRRYLMMIDDTVNRFRNHRIKASFAHQELSLIVRLFYAEVDGFHAELLTLSDLKKTELSNLTRTIEQYYPSEFNMLENGSVESSSQIARELIMNDEILKGIKKPTSDNHRQSGEGHR